VDRTSSTIVVVLVLLVVLGLMALGWWRRARRQRDLPRPDAVPADAGEVRHRAVGLHVATTFAESRLDRVAVHGLGFRARTRVTVTTAGVELDLAGAEPIWIARADLGGVDRSSWTIDRGVERDGLVVIRWRLGPRELDTNLRVERPAELAAALAALAEPEAPVAVEAPVAPAPTTAARAADPLPASAPDPAPDPEEGTRP
jgi:hypothetical protein